MTGLRTAVTFLTLLPSGGNEWEPARAARWYPAVSLLLAAVLAAVAAAAYTAFGPLLAAALIVAAWAAITGALHLDGLADTADAAFAPVDRPRRLAILADVHHGTFATVAVLLVLVLKVAALSGFDRRQAIAAVVVAVTSARCLLPLLMRMFPAARPGGLGDEARKGATPLVVAGAAALALVVSAVAFGATGVAIVAAVAAASVFVARWLAGRFGGLTGDTFGAIVELVETATLVTIAGLATNGHARSFAWIGDS